MQRSTTVSPYRSQPRLITRSTILILSGWFVGAATGRAVPNGTEHLALLVGVTGLLAFVGLEYAAFQRKKCAAALDLAEVAEKLEHRVRQKPSVRPFGPVIAPSALRIREWLDGDRTATLSTALHDGAA